MPHYSYSCFRHSVLAHSLGSQQKCSHSLDNYYNAINGAVCTAQHLFHLTAAISFTIQYFVPIITISLLRAHFLQFYLFHAITLIPVEYPLLV